MEHCEQVTSIERIRELHQSKASCTWGSGLLDDKGRVLLQYLSPSHPGDEAVIEYCSEEDWLKAFPNNGE